MRVRCTGRYGNGLAEHLLRNRETEGSLDSYIASGSIVILNMDNRSLRVSLVHRAYARYFLFSYYIPSLS